LQQARRRFTIRTAGQAITGASLGADPQPAFHIFISYRREGTSAHAGRLHDLLVAGVEDQTGFSHDQIFMDIDTIAPGDDFRKVIAAAVAGCDVLLAVIGRQWTTVKEARRRRLDNPADYVRLEIEAAVKREIPVVPVLVDHAKMPKESELPSSMADLAYRNAVELSDIGWHQDVGRLLGSLKKRESTKAEVSRTRKATTPRKQGGTARRKASTSSATDASKRKVVASRLGGPSVGDVYVGRAEEWAGQGLGLKVLIGPEMYGTLPGKSSLDGGGGMLKTDSGEVVRVGDVLRVKIEEIDERAGLVDSDKPRFVLSYVGRTLQSRVGPAT
jgi:hypothetical protein